VSELFFREFGPADGPVVLAIHGITASHLAWLELAAAAPELRIIAPDLRGRGASSGLPGPWAMQRHADDVVAILDSLGIERAPLVGHSMGAMVSNVAAHRHPDRVGGVLLVDGGLTLRLPEGASPDPDALLGPAAERLSMHFDSLDQYRRFWKQHPALGEWSDNLDAYVEYDLVDGQSRTSVDAMRQNAVEAYGTPAIEAAVAAIRPGTTMLFAPRGLLNEAPGLYPPAERERWASELGVEFVEVPDTNHYTIVMAPRGAAVVAEHVRRLVE
jgi:pimeloyl-ACP methyl ester carboxylesterase